MAASRETPQDREDRESVLAAGASSPETTPPGPKTTKSARPAKRASRQTAPPDQAIVLEADPAPTFGRRPAQGEKRSLVGSAARIKIDDRKAIQALRYRRQAWQSEAWDYADEVPEIGHTLDFTANLLSKLRLFSAVRPDPTGPPVPVDDPAAKVDPTDTKIAMDVLNRLSSIEGGQSVLLGDLAYNLEVAGECYLHGHEDPDTGEEDWNVRSVDELVVTGDSFALRAGPGVHVYQQIPADDVVIRLWQKHRRFGQLATCAMRRVLSAAENLLLLDRELRATAQSRLPNGLLLVSQDMSFGPPDPTRDLGDGDARDDPFLSDLDEAFRTAIQEPGAASAAQPIVVQVPYDQVEHGANLVKLGRDLDATLESRQEAQVMRVARGLAMPVEVSTGLQECVDVETEILSTRGWLRYDELAEGDLVLTLNVADGLSEWQAVKRVARYEVAAQPMLSIQRKAHSSLSTLNHRWPVILHDSGSRRWRESAYLNTNHRFITAAPCVGLPTEPKWSDALVELVAWFYTEGSVDRRSYRDGGTAIISQSVGANPGHVARIRAALVELAGPPAVSLHRSGPSWKAPGRPVARTWVEKRDKNRPMARFVLSHSFTAELETVAPDRRPTFQFLRELTLPQLERFLAVSRMADGWTVNSGTRMFSQNDRARLEAYEFACILSGRTPSSWTVPDRSGRYASQIMCSVTDRSTVQPISSKVPAEIELYTGTVWCPSLDNGTWLARRNGKVYFTGNTTFANAAQVKRSEWESYGEPKATLMVDALTSGYYQWMLVEAGMDRVQARQHFIWYDPSACIAAPDPVTFADKDHEDGVISDEARRRLHGHSEADAPTDDEIARRMLFRATRIDPTVMAQLFKITGIAPDIQIPMPQNGFIGDKVDQPEAAGKIVAAATLALPAGASRGRRLGRQLASIDMDLRTRLRTEANASMRRALEKAGNRLRSKASDQHDSAIRNLAASVPSAELAAVMGPGMVTAVGFAADDLLRGAFHDLAATFSAWTSRAYRQALQAYQAEGGAFDADQEDALTAAADVRTADAAEWLLGAVAALAARRLYDPTPGVEPQGEVAEGVPAGIIRQAMALAGGWQPAEGANGSVLAVSGGPVGGVAVSADIVGLLADSGGGVEGYVWVYGPAPRQSPFEPHELMDGVSFSSWDDDVLVNDEGWPDDLLYPGDHDGCLCDAEPVLFMPEGNIAAEVGPSGQLPEGDEQ